VKVLVVTNMYPTLEQPAFGTFVRDQVDALRRKGVDIDLLFIDGRKGNLSYVGGAFRTWGRLLKRRYDVVHAHYVLSGIVARLQPVLPVVVTYHGSELGVGPDHWLSKLTRAVHPLFDSVIVVSPKMRAALEDPKVHVVPCGIDLEDFGPIPVVQARQQLGLPPHSPLVLWPGDPKRPEKRFRMLEQAVEQVRQAMPNVELVLVSGKPHDVIPIYMSACDVLGLTSAYEGSPMVIKEAMACNLPIVSVDVGDVAEVIGGTDHCYLVEPTPEAVAEKLLLVLSNRQRTNGRSKVGHLSSAAIADQLIDIYKEVCRS
jgi:teichuronic acid biosynthesis glycosyltransferase TuaC